MLPILPSIHKSLASTGSAAEWNPTAATKKVAYRLFYDNNGNTLLNENSALTLGTGNKDTVLRNLFIIFTTVAVAGRNITAGLSVPIYLNYYGTTVVVKPGGADPYTAAPTPYVEDTNGHLAVTISNTQPTPKAGLTPGSFAVVEYAAPAVAASTSLTAAGIPFTLSKIPTGTIQNMIGLLNTNNRFKARVGIPPSILGGGAPQKQRSTKNKKKAFHKTRKQK